MSDGSECGFKASLFRHCHAKACGSFFLVTSDNRSAQVVLYKGNLIGVNYADLSANQALLELFSMSDLRFSFQNDLIYPVRDTLIADDAFALLQGFGFVSIVEDIHEDTIEAEVVTEPYSQDSGLMYRGQKVYKDQAKPLKRSHLVYRGQQLSDAD